jgi:hypothetical protein
MRLEKRETKGVETDGTGGTKVTRGGKEEEEGK